MNSGNKKSEGYFGFGIGLHLAGTILCVVSSISVYEETNGKTAMKLFLIMLLYPLFYIFGTILIVNRYYYHKHIWKSVRIATGVILLSFALIAIAICATIDNMGLGYAGLYELICGIIVLSNQNKILYDNSVLPNKVDVERDKKPSTYDTVRQIPINQGSVEMNVRNPQIQANNISPAYAYSGLVRIGGDISVADRIQHFSMADIDAISVIENTTKKGKLFEKYVAQILEYNTYTDVSIIGGSGDLGGDIEARKANRKVIIQCKCYSGSVPYRAIQEVFSASRTRGGIPIVITNSHFSKQSIDNAEIQGVKLYDREELQKMIEIANEVIDSERSYERNRIRERIEERIEEEPVEETIPERHIDIKTEKEIKGKNISEKDANKELALRMLDSFGNE